MSGKRENDSGVVIVDGRLVRNDVIMKEDM